jgi:hypothetical protein
VAAYQDLVACASDARCHMSTTPTAYTAAHCRCTGHPSRMSSHPTMHTVAQTTHIY